MRVEGSGESTTAEFINSGERLTAEIRLGRHYKQFMYHVLRSRELIRRLAEDVEEAFKNELVGNSIEHLLGYVSMLS